jgi:hypothetical protein
MRLRVVLWLKGECKLNCITLKDDQCSPLFCYHRHCFQQVVNMCLCFFVIVLIERSVNLWRSRYRWWANRHFSKGKLALDIATGNFYLFVCLFITIWRSPPYASQGVQWFGWCTRVLNEWSDLLETLTKVKGGAMLKAWVCYSPCQDFNPLIY